MVLADVRAALIERRIGKCRSLIRFERDRTVLFECCSRQSRFYFREVELPPRVVYHRASSVLSVIESPMSMLRCIDGYRSTGQRDEPREQRFLPRTNLSTIPIFTSSSCRRKVRFSLFAHSMFSWHRVTCGEKPIVGHRKRKTVDLPLHRYRLPCRERDRPEFGRAWPLSLGSPDQEMDALI